MTARLLAALLLLAACHVGADPPDASVGPGPPDAAVTPPPPDAAAVPGPDASVPCSVDGMPGVCLDVADCTGTSTPGFCPGPAEIQCCTTGAALACDGSERPTPNEGLTEEPGQGGCPAGMAPVDDFCIDRFEAALEQVGAAASWSPYHNPAGQQVRAVSLRAAVPQGYINGEQAAAACAEAGKRLCTDAEWLRACRGAADTLYPYGDTRTPGVCNDDRPQHPAVEYFGTSDPSVFGMIGHPCLNQLADSVHLTGANPGCVSDEGIVDMVGNLHEWTADPAGTFRGGYYMLVVGNGGDGCQFRTVAHDTSHWDYSTGFRCCAD